MKEQIKKLLKNILFDTFIYIITIVIITWILSAFGYAFLNWFYNLSVVLVVIGIIVGTMQLINKAIKKKKTKVIINVVIIIMELIIISPITFIYFLFQGYQEIVYKDGNKMIKETHSVLLSNWINYYDYENMFIRKKQERIYEAHNNRIGEYLYTNYYDENGKLIKTDDTYYRNSDIYFETKK